MSRTLLRITLYVIGLALLVDGVRGCEDEEYPELSENVQRTAAVTYGVGNVASDGDTFEQVPLLLDVLSPTDGVDSGRPGLILVHGGGFESGSREDEELVRFADALAAQGIVCFLIDYRLLQHHPPAPEAYADDPLWRAAHAAIVDVKLAIRYVHAHAEVYGVAPERIGVMGESAGAIAVLGAAVTDAGIFATDGPAFPLSPENHPTASSAVSAAVIFWGSGDEVLEHLDPADPALLIVHGTADENPATPYAHAEAIAARCEAEGIPYELVPLPGARHGAWHAQTAGQDLATLTLSFLQEHLK